VSTRWAPRAEKTTNRPQGSGEEGAPTECPISLTQAVPPGASRPWSRDAPTGPPATAGGYGARRGDVTTPRSDMTRWGGGARSTRHPPPAAASRGTPKRPRRAPTRSATRRRRRRRRWRRRRLLRGWAPRCCAGGPGAGGTRAGLHADVPLVGRLRGRCARRAWRRVSAYVGGPRSRVRGTLSFARRLAEGAATTPRTTSVVLAARRQRGAAVGRRPRRRAAPSLVLWPKKRKSAMPAALSNDQ